MSAGSIGSALSIGSIGSALSIGSIGSALSIGSAGSLLSIGSVRSTLAIGSVRSTLAIGGVGERRPTGRADQGPDLDGDRDGAKAARLGQVLAWTALVSLAAAPATGRT